MSATLQSHSSLSDNGSRQSVSRNTAWDRPVDGGTASLLLCSTAANTSPTTTETIWCWSSYLGSQHMTLPTCCRALWRRRQISRAAANQLHVATASSSVATGGGTCPPTPVRPGHGNCRNPMKKVGVGWGTGSSWPNILSELWITVSVCFCAHRHTACVVHRPTVHGLAAKYPQYAVSFRRGWGLRTPTRTHHNIPISTQPCIYLGSLNRVSASAGVKAGMSRVPGGR